MTEKRCCLASGVPPFHHAIDCTSRRQVEPTTANTAPKTCTDPSPRWFVSHWRDWHRGHGCDLDDGKPRSTAATAEIEQHAANESTGFLTDAELRMLRASTTSGNELLVRALDELVARRAVEKVKLPSAPVFDHGTLCIKHFEPLLGYCVCPHCAKLPV
jgi:hypothetical protein